MSALSYLLLTRLKNTLKSIVTIPTRLIFTVIFTALFVFVLVIGAQNSHGGMARDLSELYAIAFALFGFMYVLTAMSGLSNGASFFSMADVNLLFGLPISTRRILNYGLLRQLGSTLMMGFFIFFQYGWLSATYNISPLDLIGLFLCFGLTVFCGQMTAMGIYSLTSSDDRKKRVVRAVVYAVCTIIIALSVLPAIGKDDFFTALSKNISSSTYFGYIPIAGWMAGLSLGLIQGSLIPVITGLLLTAAFVLFFMTVVLKKDADFYEDVLAATEVSFSAITAKKEGRAAEVMPRNVKTGKTGLGRGSGASAFFFKHLIENRRMRIFLLDGMTLIFAAVSIGFAYIMRASGPIPGLAFSCYMMIFGTFTGRWNKELLLPYVYLVPEKPFKKLVMICCESIYKSALEAIFIFVPIAFFTGMSVVQTVCCILVRVGLALALIAATVLSERLFGALPIKAIQMMLYMLMLIVIVVPGIVLAVVLAINYAFTLEASLLTLFVYFIAVSALIGFLCRDVLDYAELNNQ